LKTIRAVNYMGSWESLISRIDFLQCSSWIPTRTSVRNGLPENISNTSALVKIRSRVCGSQRAKCFCRSEKSRQVCRDVLILSTLSQEVCCSREESFI
jgi:hypothetical protein